MKKLLYIFNNIRESFRSRPIAYIIVIFAAIVSGFVSTVTYALVKVDIKDISLIPCNNYSIPSVKQECQNEETLDKILEILPKYDLINSKFDPSNYDMINAYIMNEKELDIRDSQGEKASNLNNNPSIGLSWSKKIFDEEYITNGSKVVVMSNHYARTDKIHIGDNITINGDTFTVLGFIDKYLGSPINIIIPYTTRFTNIKLYPSVANFVSKEAISEADLKILSGFFDEHIYISKEISASVIIFILSTIVCALNVLIATAYIAKKSRYKYAVSKVLGASNLFISTMLLVEVAVFAIIGILIGISVAYGLLYGLGIIEYFSITISGVDFAIIICFNMVATLLVNLFYTIKNAMRKPIER